MVETVCSICQGMNDCHQYTAEIDLGFSTIEREIEVCGLCYQHFKKEFEE